MAMKDRSSLYTAEEIRIKIHNLTSRYRKGKGNIGSTGGSPSDWPLYYKVHAMLGKFKLNNVNLLVEESIVEDSSLEILSGEELHVHQHASSSLSAYEASSLSPEMQVDKAPLSSPVVTSVVSPEDKAEKRKKSDMQMELLKEFRKVNESIRKELEEVKKVDEKLIIIEEKRNELLQDFVNDSKEFQKAVISFLSAK